MLATGTRATTDPMTSLEFKELSADMAAVLRTVSHYKRYTKNENVFLEGDRYAGPYLVVEGQFKIYMLGEDGKESIMHIFRTNELIAGGPIFLGGTYPASCSALSDGCLVAFEYERLKKIIQSHAMIHSFFLEHSVRLMPRLKEKIENITLRTGEERICAYFRSLGADKAAVTLDIQKNQLAALLDLTPESVSRIFNQLQARGALVVEDKTYRLNET